MPHDGINIFDPPRWGWQRLSRVPRLSRNFLLNLLGFGLPLLAALIAVPALTSQAGLARFGFLSIAWVLVGYVGFLDLGLSRVFARRVAVARSQGDAALQGEAAALARASSLALIGTVVAALLLGLGVPVERWATEVPAAELRLAWWALLLALPAIVVANLQRGAMEGLEAFGAVNVLRIAFGAWMFAGPLLVLQVTHDLTWLVLALTAGRWAALGFHWAWCRRLLPRPATASPALLLWPAVREGLWMTLSNVVGPLMVVFDRVVLATLAGLAAVSAYAIAQEIALRLLLVPAALSLALFPRLAALDAVAASASAAQLGDRGVRWVTAAMLPLCVAGVLGGGDLLALWLAPAIAAQTEVLLAVLLVGVAANAGAQVLFGMLQAVGRARSAAMLHLAELPLYAAALWWAVQWHGVKGAAWVWVARIVLDAIAMLLLVRTSHASMIGVRLVVGWLGATAAVVLAIFAEGRIAQASAAVAALLAMLVLVPARELKSPRTT